MDFEESITAIHSLEEAFDVTALTYRGIHIWPLLRIKLWMELVSFRKASLHKNQSLAESAVAMGRATVFALYHHMDLRQAPGNLDIVFVTRTSSHSDQIDEQYYDRHIDPVMETATQDYTAAKVESLTLNTPATLPRFHKTLFANTVSYRALNGIAAKLGLHSNIEAHVQQFGAFRKVYEAIIGPFPLDEAYILGRIGDIHHSARFFERILSRLRPKLVAIAVYYDTLGLGLMLAASRLGIPSIDIQHGKQGKFHGAYDLWSRLPSGGYDILPNYFWVWGEESRQNMRRIETNGHVHHRPIVGGNRWIAKWVHGEDGHRISTEAQPFYERISAGSRSILVTLQPYEQPLLTPMLEAMVNAPNDWLWLVRLHPTHRHATDKIQQTLKQAGVANVELHHATAEPLYALLQHIDHHVTAWSSVGYEALVFDVPTTLVDPIALELYDDYLNRRIFSYAASGEELLNCINNAAILHNHAAVTEPYIVVDDNIAHSAFKTILDGSV